MSDKTPLENRSVLLIEDEFLIAIDAETMLRELGAAAVEIVSNFEAALEHAENGSYDLVVLDLNLNGTLSFPIAEAFERRNIPVVFASGYELRNRPLAGFPGGTVVSKPYTAERFREAIESRLGLAPKKSGAAKS